MMRSQRIEDRMLLHVMASNTCPPPWCAPHLHHLCFTSLQPVRLKEASDSVSTIRDVMPLTVELAVRFSLRTQCKCCSTGAYKISLRKKTSVIGCWSNVRKISTVCRRTCKTIEMIVRIETTFIGVRVWMLVATASRFSQLRLAV